MKSVKQHVKKLTPLAASIMLVLGTSSSAFAGMGGGGMGGGGGGDNTVVTGQSSYTVNVRNVDKTMSDSQTVRFWGFNSELPAPTIIVGEGDTFDLGLNMMMAPQESAPYNGHTIHLHGLDVPTAEDGVPETGAPVNGDTYTFTTGAGWAGTYAYHCHVHTVKHLEMGMYGMIVVKPVDAQGNTTNELYSGGPTYDHELYWTLSTVDPDYHTATGDSTVFADYNPQYFLVYGKEGLSRNAPANDLAANGGDNVVFRLSGMHSTNSTFSVLDGNNNPQQFTVYMQAGRTLQVPETVTSLDIAPGQTFDAMITLPSGSGALYPQVEYKTLRDNTPYTNGTVYNRITY